MARLAAGAPTYPLSEDAEAPLRESRRDGTPDVGSLRVAARQGPCKIDGTKLTRRTTLPAEATTLAAELNARITGTMAELVELRESRRDGGAAGRRARRGDRTRPRATCPAARALLGAPPSRLTPAGEGARPRGCTSRFCSARPRTPRGVCRRLSAMRVRHLPLELVRRCERDRRPQAAPRSWDVEPGEPGPARPQLRLGRIGARSRRRRRCHAAGSRRPHSA